MSTSPSLRQPKPGCVAAFLGVFVLATVAAWIWAFYPPMPSRDDLQEVKGTVAQWEEKEVPQGKGMAEHELHVRLAGQRPEYLVERYGYDRYFKHGADPAPGTELTLLVEKADVTEGLEVVRTRAVRSAAVEYFTLDGYRAGVTERRSWGWAAATVATLFTGFALQRVWSRRRMLRGAQGQPQAHPDPKRRAAREGR